MPLFIELGDDKRLQEEADNGWKMLSAPSTVKFMENVMSGLSKAKI